MRALVICSTNSKNSFIKISFTFAGDGEKNDVEYPALLSNINRIKQLYTKKVVNIDRQFHRHGGRPSVNTW